MTAAAASSGGGKRITQNEFTDKAWQAIIAAPDIAKQVRTVDALEWHAVWTINSAWQHESYILFCFIHLDVCMLLGGWYMSAWSVEQPQCLSILMACFHHGSGLSVWMCRAATR